jgi:hypothetical protein
MGLLYVGFNGEPIFQPVNVNHAIYAKILIQLKMLMKCRHILHGMTT